MQTKASFCGLHLDLLLQEASPVSTLGRESARVSSQLPPTLSCWEKLCSSWSCQDAPFPRRIAAATDPRMAGEGRSSWGCTAPLAWHNGFGGRKRCSDLYPQPLGCKPRCQNSEQDRHWQAARARAGCRGQELGTMGRIWGAAGAAGWALPCAGTAPRASGGDLNQAEQADTLGQQHLLSPSF